MSTFHEKEAGFNIPMDKIVIDRVNLVAAHYVEGDLKFVHIDEKKISGKFTVFLFMGQNITQDVKNEWIQISDNLKEIKRLGCRVFGVMAESHGRVRQTMKAGMPVQFPVISDYTGELRQAFGVGHSEASVRGGHEVSVEKDGQLKRFAKGFAILDKSMKMRYLSLDHESVPLDTKHLLTILCRIIEVKKNKDMDAEEDSVEAPSCPYKIQPENQGKLIWITGQGGTGKCTAAQQLSKTAGYVYYESECFWTCKNPYIPADAPELTMIQDQRNLVGEGLEERRRVHQKATESFRQVMLGEEYDIEDYEDYFELMCQDIKKERKRIGGDWVIAGLTGMLREERDFMRSCLGPELIFVVLIMEEEELRKRILNRHRGDPKLDEELLERIVAVNEMVDPAGDDEENALQVKVTHHMTREDLAKKILGMIQQLEKED